MHKFRDQLMKLPVPPLQQTLEKYIASVEVRNLLLCSLVDIHARFIILMEIVKTRNHCVTQCIARCLQFCKHEFDHNSVAVCSTNTPSLQ